MFRKSTVRIIITLVVMLYCGFSIYAAGAAEETETKEVVEIEFSMYAVMMDNIDMFENDRIKKHIEDKLNIKLVWKSGMEEYDQNLITSMAAGTAADLVNLNGKYVNATTFGEWVEDGAVFDMGKAVFDDPERYPALKLAFDSSYFRLYNKLVSGEFDNYYAWYTPSYLSRGFGGMMFNKELLNKIDGEIPETFDDFIALLRKAKNQLDNVTPFAWLSYVGADWNEIDFIFFRTHGSYIGHGADYNRYFQDKSGNWYDAAIAPENKELWKQLQGYYEEGLLDRNWLRQSTYEWVSNDFVNGKVLCGDLYLPITGQYMWAFNKMQEKYPDLTYEDMPMLEQPLVGPEGDIPKTLGMPLSGGIGQPLYFIPYNAEHPDRVLDLLNYMVSDEGQELIYWGVKGIHYTKDDKSDFNEEEFLKDANIYWHDGYYRPQYAWFRTLTTAGQSFAPFVEKGDWIEGIKDSVNILTERMSSTGPGLIASGVEDTFRNESYITLPPYYGMLSWDEEETLIKTKLDDIRKKWFAEFLLGEKSVETEWDAFVEEYTAAGANDILSKYVQKLGEAKLIFDDASQ